MGVDIRPSLPVRSKALPTAPAPLHVGAVFCIAILSLFLHPVTAAAADEEYSLIRRIFPEALSIEDATMWPTDSDRAAIRAACRLPFDAPYVRYSRAQDTISIIGYAFLDDVKGLHEMITYLTALNADGSVRAVEVLAYRESYGGEIRNERFRRQFVGKTIRDPLRVGTDIRNIAGATISTNAVASGVRKILAVYDVEIKRGRRKPLATDRHTQTNTDTDRGGRGVGEDAAKGVRRMRAIWGTTLTIEIDGGGDAEDAIDACFLDVESLTGVFSRYDTTSEISRINTGAGWVNPSKPFRDLHFLAMEMTRVSAGTFNPTKRSDGMKFVEVTKPVPGDSVLIRVSNGVTLDFDGIAKGYAVDRMTGILKRRRPGRALINFGESSIAAICGGDSRAWKVDIRDARAPHGNTPLVTLTLCNAVVSVSGTYERGPHIIDPFTGKPAAVSLQAVIVGRLQTDAGARTDALSTALFVAGPKGLGFVREAGFEGMWVGPDQTNRTKRFLDYEKAP